MSGSFREFLTPCSIGLWARSVKVVTSAQLSSRFGPVADLLQVQSAVVKDRFVAFGSRGGRGTRDIAAGACPPGGIKLIGITSFSFFAAYYIIMRGFCEKGEKGAGFIFQLGGGVL